MWVLGLLYQTFCFSQGFTVGKLSFTVEKGKISIIYMGFTNNNTLHLQRPEHRLYQFSLSIWLQNYVQILFTYLIDFITIKTDNY